MDTPKTQLDAQIILRTLSEHSEKLYALGARKLGLFGSFVRGEQTPESDIDILVTMARPSYDDYCNVKFYLEDFFGRKVDLGYDELLREEIRPHVMREVRYIELHGKHESPELKSQSGDVSEEEIDTSAT